jgi:hypothetical protein
MDDDDGIVVAFRMPNRAELRFDIRCGESLLVNYAVSHRVVATIPSRWS